MAEAEGESRQNARRISFSDDVNNVEAAVAAAAAAAAAPDTSQSDKVEAAWAAAPKRETGELAASELGAILESMESSSGGVKGGVAHFIRHQEWLREMQSLSKNDFEIACGELDDWQAMTEEEIAEACTEAPNELPPHMLEKLTSFFDKLDVDKDKSITQEEAISHWGKNFAKINATAMFHEVDVDGDGKVTVDEWLSFWKNVLDHGYTAEVRLRAAAARCAPRPAAGPYPIPHSLRVRRRWRRSSTSWWRVAPGSTLMTGGTRDGVCA